MRMIDYLLNNYDTDADVHWLVDYHDIWPMPEVNPDGHHIVEAGGGGNSPYYYRKNGNNIGGSGCSWPPTVSDHFGVDNNRNFPFQVGTVGRLERFCVRPDLSRDVEGSEPEDTAILNIDSYLVPDQPTPATPTRRYHCHRRLPKHPHNARVNLFTWGWTTTQMPNYSETRNIAAHMAAPNAGETITPMARSSKSCIR